jgi:cell division transport system ATP-binding protein
MATHEAGFVDKMLRRVIELRDGSLVRDEMGGAYGDTSALATLRPEVIRGASAQQAFTAATELRRDVEEGRVEPVIAADIPEQKAVPTPATTIPPIEVEVEEAGMADRLGIAGSDDEVGPTS